jgi:hypothetical protein
MKQGGFACRVLSIRFCDSTKKLILFRDCQNICHKNLLLVIVNTLPLSSIIFLYARLASM